MKAPKALVGSLKHCSRRGNNSGWHCKELAVPGRRWCEYHLAEGRRHAKVAWKNPSYRRKSIRRGRANGRKLRQEVLEAYGRKCVCCGQSTEEFLGIDHIKGGGTKHRRKLKRYGSTFYRYLKKKSWPIGYRILCHNCNLSLGFYGYCPHEST